MHKCCFFSVWWVLCLSVAQILQLLQSSSWHGWNHSLKRSIKVLNSRKCKYHKSAYSKILQDKVALKSGFIDTTLLTTN